jgi:hypothetical protein
MANLLKKELDKLGSATEAAEKLGVTAAYIYMLKQGVRRPSDSVLKILGLERVDRLVKVKA